MILLDANLLVYAYVTGLPEHRPARAWLDRTLSGANRVGLPWPSTLAFVRLVSNPRVFQRPVSSARAWQQVDAWLDVPNVWIPAPTDAHRRVLAQMLRRASAPGHVPDAHLAALAVEHGLKLCTADSGFSRFPGLRWENPLQR